jgi:hypothetical protein
VSILQGPFSVAPCQNPNITIRNFFIAVQPAVVGSPRPAAGGLYTTRRSSAPPSSDGSNESATESCTPRVMSASKLKWEQNGAVGGTVHIRSPKRCGGVGEGACLSVRPVVELV